MQEQVKRAVVHFIFRVYHHICQLLSFRNNRNSQSTVCFCMAPKLRLISKGSLKNKDKYVTETQLWPSKPKVSYLALYRKFAKDIIFPLRK